MFHFGTEDIQLDLIELLSTFGIPVTVYQRLEFVFRQVMMTSPTLQVEYRHHEPRVDLASINQSCVDDALDEWHTRYPGQTYGFSSIVCGVVEGRAKARLLYRNALTSFAAFSEMGDLPHQWLAELHAKLRFHIGRNEDVDVSPAEDLLFYLAASELVYRPFFELHFQNRRHTTEKLHEFLAVKLMLEAGRAINIPDLTRSKTPLTAAIEDIKRHLRLPIEWVESLTIDSYWYQRSA